MTIETLLSVIMGMLVLYAIAMVYAFWRLCEFVRWMFRQNNPHLFDDLDDEPGDLR